MILKGNQRAGAKDLAQHLMNAADNEHVTLHELRGFVADDLPGALRETQFVAKGTKCRQYLFSLSLNPPQDQTVSVDAFEQAVLRIEDKLGLTDQPRALVFHEKEGRRHAHCVWSRIDADSMTAINLPFYKNRLTELSRDLYLEHGWKLPDGLKDRSLANPLNFTREEWIQAQRTQSDPRELKQMFRECWTQSDSAKALNLALKERGMVLAKGDRRGFVAVDHKGEVYSLSRWTGQETKALQDRLGDPAALMDVATAKERIEKAMTPKLDAFRHELDQKHALQLSVLADERRAMTKAHGAERHKLDVQQKERWQAECLARSKHFRKGVRGIWDWMSGKSAAIRRKNEHKALEGIRRDRQQRDDLVVAQLGERAKLQERIVDVRQDHRQEQRDLSREVGRYLNGLHNDKTLAQSKERGKKQSLSSTFAKARKNYRANKPKRGLNRDKGRGRER